MEIKQSIKPISLVKSFMIFLSAGFLFYCVIKILVPWISEISGATEYIVWMFTGTLVLFLPLFITTFCLLKRDGYQMNIREVTKALNLKRITKKDVKYIAFGMIAATILCGVIIAGMLYFHLATVESLYSVSPIKVYPLHDKQLWFVLFLPVFFFFNYVGEETLWRGYILPRQLVSNYGRYAVILNAVFHCVYHFVFGWEPLVMMFPMMFLMPYIVSKTKNTWTSIIIHFLIGAPSQVLIVLGLISH